MATAYLDNSATTRPCDAAIEAMVDCMREGFYNPSSVYKPAVEAFTRLRDARQTLLKPIRGMSHRLVFTSGGTEANNLAILGAVHRMHGRQKVARSAVEHPSVQAAFDELAKEGHEVIVLPVDSDGSISYDALEAALQSGVSLVSCMQVNNETGALLDARALYRQVNGRALVHIDGVQGYLRAPMDLAFADLYSFSAHKIHGPKGVGALAVREGVRLEARQLGGGQENALRSGTENTPGIAGFAAAARWMVSQQPELSQALMQKKLRLIQGILERVSGAMVNGPEPENAAPHIANISFAGVRGETMLHALEARGVYVSTGSACSSKKQKVSAVLTAMGIPAKRTEGALRFSLGALTTDEEIETAIEATAQAYAQLAAIQRR
ncbi:MAG: cysteine desulfurase [Clostridia bacterium]|nr:cysteine desulfurase [Clostridia bacterium]